MKTLQERANIVFNYYEEKIYEKEEGSCSLSVYFSFYDWLCDDENFDTILDQSKFLEDIKDVDEAEKETTELIKFILAGLDNFFDNAWENQIKLIKGEK